MGYFQLCNIFAKKISVMRIVGLGYALTDVLARLSSDACFQEIGLLKGGMQLIDEERLLKIMSIFEGLDTTLASGGSAANAVSGVTRMGIEGGFIGKVIDKNNEKKMQNQDLLTVAIQKKIDDGSFKTNSISELKAKLEK